VSRVVCPHCGKMIRLDADGDIEDDEDEDDEDEDDDATE